MLEMFRKRTTPSGAKAGSLLDEPEAGHEGCPEELSSARLSSARLWAVTGILIISFSAIFVRLAEVTPTTSAFFRTSYALPFLFALWFLQRRSTRRPPRDRLLAVAVGIFLGLDLAFWHRAIEMIGAGLATVLGNTQVVFVGFLAWVLYGERPSRRALAAAPIVFVGVVLISGVGTADAFGSDPRMGAVFGLLTGITYAIFLLGFRTAGRSLGAPAGPLLDATVGATFGALAVGAVDGQLDFTITWPAHGWLLALAVGSQVIGWQLIGAALPRLPALETSVFMLLQPMLTTIWARLLFAEHLATSQIAGMVLVLTGVGWLSLSSRDSRGTLPATDRKAYDHEETDRNRDSNGDANRLGDQDQRLR